MAPASFLACVGERSRWNGVGCTALKGSDASSSGLPPSGSRYAPSGAPPALRTSSTTALISACSMGSATSRAERPRFTSAGASFARLPGFLAAAFFLAAMGVLLRFDAEDDARCPAVGEIGPGPVDEHDEPAAETDQE